MSQAVSLAPARKGPVPEVGFVDYGGGEVRYATEGWGWFVAQRRRAALRKARKHCKGMDYKITDETVREVAEAPYTGDDLDDNFSRGTRHYNVNPFNHITFECVGPRPERPSSPAALPAGIPGAPVKAAPAPASVEISSPAVAVEISSPAIAIEISSPSLAVEFSSPAAPSPDPAPVPAP